MNLKPGQYVRHAKYGCGTILARDEERTKVDFDTVGVKLFVTPLAVFEIAEEKPPKKKRAAARPRAKRSAQ